MYAAKQQGGRYHFHRPDMEPDVPPSCKQARAAAISPVTTYSSSQLSATARYRPGAAPSPPPEPRGLGRKTFPATIPPAMGPDASPASSPKPNMLIVAADIIQEQQGA